MMEFYEFPPQQQNYTLRSALPPAPTTPPARTWSLGFLLILAFIAVLGASLSSLASRA